MRQVRRQHGAHRVVLHVPRLRHEHRLQLAGCKHSRVSFLSTRMSARFATGRPNTVGPFACRCARAAVGSSRALDATRVGLDGADQQPLGVSRPRARATRPRSADPSRRSSMTLTTSWASVASKQRPSNGSSSAGARMTWTPGWRPRRAATNSSDGSTAVTRPGVALLASSAVSAPGPHPTSRTRPSSGSPAKSAKGTASGLE